MTALQPSLWLTLGGVFVITALVYAVIDSAATHARENTDNKNRWQQLQTDVWFITESWLLQSMSDNYLVIKLGRDDNGIYIA